MLATHEANDRAFGGGGGGGVNVVVGGGRGEHAEGHR